jgi:hypothetical protein
MIDLVKRLRDAADLMAQEKAVYCPLLLTCAADELAAAKAEIATLRREVARRDEIIDANGAVP